MHAAKLIAGLLTHTVAELGLGAELKDAAPASLSCSHVCLHPCLPLQRLCNWIDAAKRSCTAFDFPTKGILQVNEWV